MLIGLSSRIVCNLSCFLYPAYASYKALSLSPINSQEATRQLERWLMYWAVVGSWVGVEAVAGWFLSLIPFYSLCKLIFFLWLSLPQTEGSTYLYTTILAPTFHEHERDIDAFLAGLQGRLSGVLISALTWAWGKAKGTLDLNIDLVNSSDSTTSQARPIDADPDFRLYPVATGPQPPTLQDPASGVMQQAYSVATRYAFQYLPVAINALQNARNPAPMASRAGQTQQPTPRPVYPAVGGYEILSQSPQYPTHQPGFDVNVYPGPSQTIRQAVSSIYASSNTHPSTSDNPESLTHRRSGLLNPNQQPNPTPPFISGATSRSASDQDVPGTRASGSSHSSWGVASGYDEIRREEVDDDVVAAAGSGAGVGARPGSARRTSSWFRWSSGAAAGEQDFKDKTE